MDDDAQHDQTNGDQTVDAESEELSLGSWRDPIARWFRSRWRIGLICLIVLCIGLGVGGFGGHIWTKRHQQRRPRISATLYQSGSYRGGKHNKVNLRLHNAGGKHVTIDKALLHIPGFDVESGGLDHQRKISHKASTDIPYRASADCKVRPKGAATARVRVRGPHEDKQWVTERIPLRPGGAWNSLVELHNGGCRGPSWIKMKTLRVSSRSGSVLALRVRLTPKTQTDKKPRKRVRLYELQSNAEVSDSDKLRVSFRSSKSKGSFTRLPATGTLKIKMKKIKDCDSQLPPEPLPLTASLKATNYDSDSAMTYVNYDLRAAAAVLNFTEKHCD